MNPAPLQHQHILRDGRTLVLERHRYPIPSPLRMRLIDLIQLQWPRTDIDWLQTMRGAWSDTLHIDAALARVGEEDVATAQVAFPADQPEVNIVMDVMVKPSHRGAGIGAIMTDWLVNHAMTEGSRVAYLGNRPGPSVYERIGFSRVSGVFMRRPAQAGDDPESGFYAPGQNVSFRAAVPGDLPGIVCLNAQPLATAVLHYQAGLVSRNFAPPGRAVASFSTLWDMTRNGAFIVATGANPHRVLGYATLIRGPKPARLHRGEADFAVHDHFSEAAPALLERVLAEARHLEVGLLDAVVSTADPKKERVFSNLGFRRTATTRLALQTELANADAVHLTLSL